MTLGNHSRLRPDSSADPTDLALPPSWQERRQLLEAGFSVPGAFTRLQRTCLSCKAMFDSAWAGERICPRCKGTTVWRSGASASISSTNQNQSRSGRKGGS
jgi:predicted RNA-binding Zn-ribbon protein involved in translation (DUF1610 family)